MNRFEERKRCRCPADVRLRGEPTPLAAPSDLKSGIKAEPHSNDSGGSQQTHTEKRNTPNPNSLLRGCPSVGHPRPFAPRVRETINLCGCIYSARNLISLTNTKFAFIGHRVLSSNDRENIHEYSCTTSHTTALRVRHDGMYVDSFEQRCRRACAILATTSVPSSKVDQTYL